MKRILTMIAVLALLLSLSICAAASSVPDWTQDGKSGITIRLKLPEDLEERGTLSLYRVGDIHEDDGNYSFVPSGVFAENWNEYADLYSSQLALDLTVYAVEQDVDCVTLDVSGDGSVTFADLELGLYLVVQKNPAEGYERITPFLVGVPNSKDGSYVYQVDASPKVQLETAPTEPSEPTEPTEPSEPSEPDLPQTGQMNWPVPVLAVSGLLLILAGAALCSGKRKETHEA